MEESELIPSEQEKIESIETIKDLSAVNKVEQSPSNLGNTTENTYKDSQKSNANILDKENSLFKRIMENGFDGITTNPNYKLLALLIILLINLSLFFLAGNIGKTFLKNSGILS